MNTQSLVTITRQSGYQFLVDFGPGIDELQVDEPVPLGKGEGPSPDQMLMAAMANCLCASLTFSLNKFKQDPGPLSASVSADVVRNEANRLRIGALNVDITLGGQWGAMPHLDRALAQFEEFCTVSMSVREGIRINVGITDSAGTRIK